MVMFGSLSAAFDPVKDIRGVSRAGDVSPQRP
jgi:hypothetical protein